MAYVTAPATTLVPAPLALDGGGAVSLALGAPTAEMLVVFAVIAAALVLFVAQPIPIDTTAIAVMVALILLEPWTGVTPEDGVAGFANPATITVLAMFVLSEGVRRTGAIQILTDRIASYAGTSERRQLLAVVGLAGPSAGIVNNTPVVAILIPAVEELADRAGTSPSKLLMPLSFAAMMGGTLTLIGTSTNLLASDVWARQGPTGEPFGMFEFTALGVLVLAVGSVYLLTVGRALTPARIDPRSSLAESFGVADYLTDVVVREESPLVGTRIRELRRDDDLDMDVIQLVRGDRAITSGLGDRAVQAGDVLAVRADDATVQRLLEEEDFDLLPDLVAAEGSLPPEVDRATVEVAEEPITGEAGGEGGDGEGERKEGRGEAALTEVVLLPGSWLTGRPFRTADFQRRFDATVLAVRHGEDVIRERMRDVRLRGGDTLLVRASPTAIERLRDDPHVILAGDERWRAFDRGKLPVAVGILAAVIGLAALDVMPIMVSALAGMVAMIATDCLEPADAYDAVNWDVIFLLAGVIPLGVAMQRSGAAAYLGDAVVAAGGALSPLAMLAVFYLGTAAFTNVISNNAAVVLMIPVAIDAAAQLGADPFAFVLAVTFAASTAFVTPVGYQTNLMVYSPGGYRFGDFVRVGLPLQLLLTVVTTLGIAAIWGV